MIRDNLSYGIANNYSNSSYRCPVVKATNNDWGDPSGPLDASDDRASGGWYNPTGQGDKVSDKVNYAPWGGSHLRVKQNGTAIPYGAAYDVGNLNIGASTVVTLTIANTGATSINLTGSPKVQLSGSAGFTVTQQPTSPIVAGGSTTFQVTVTPNQTGLQTAYVSIPNSDTPDTPYTFTMTATVKAYTISGYVRTTDGKGIAGVTLHDLPGNPLTDTSGLYTATIGAGWSQTITPHQAGYVFNPPNRPYSNVAADLTDQNYVGTIDLTSYAISGYIRTASGDPLAGVVLTGLPGYPTTNADGYYTTNATVITGWSGTVTPHKLGYTFTPANLTLTNITADRANQNFTGVQNVPLYTISGYVRNIAGIGINGITLYGFPELVSTQWDGSYQATVETGWSGTVTMNMDFNFTPHSREYTNITANQTNQNYTKLFASPDDPPIFILSWGSWGSNNGQFQSIRRIAVDQAGNVYAVDKDNHRIQKFDSQGVFLSTFGSTGAANGQFSFPSGIALDQAGNIYVADTGNNRIQKFDPTGAFMMAFGASGSADGAFQTPDDVAVDSQGNIYVADTGNHRIQKFNKSGVFLKTWGGQGSNDGQFFYPSGLCVDSADNIYVVDGGNHRIQKFSSEGTFLLKWGTGSGQFSAPWVDVAVAPTGYAYVTYAFGWIRKFDANGTFLTYWGSLDSPSGIAIDQTGNVIYVASQGTGEIYKFAYVAPLKYTLTVHTVGTGSGTVESLPAGIACGADCAEIYFEQTEVSLTAVPTAGSIFAGWSGGGCSGTGNCVVTMNSHLTVTATFQAPEINIKQGTISLPNGTGNYNFGTVAVGGNSSAVTFTIENLGTANLTLSGIQKLGSHPNDFTVTQPASTVAPNGSTMFTITFKPTATGTRTATISIANNDNYESTYTFSVTGTGQAQASNSYLLWTK